MKEKFIANKNYVLREIAGQSVLVSIGEEITDFCGIVSLNESARVLWDALQEEVTICHLVKIFLETFGIPEEKAQEDIEKTIQMMRERRLITNV